MKIVFLDIDGVLNSKSNKGNLTEEMIQLDLSKNENLVKLQMTSIDMSKVALVREICEQTNSKIVIISSWKSLSIYDELEKELVKTGLPIIDKTIDMKNRRGTEIKNYLDSHELENYVIIDDTYYDDYEELANNLVVIDYQYGISVKQKENAIQILTSTIE